MFIISTCHNNLYVVYYKGGSINHSNAIALHSFYLLQQIFSFPFLTSVVSYFILLVFAFPPPITNTIVSLYFKTIRNKIKMTYILIWHMFIIYY